MVITLIGPGGAGKTTTAFLLAERLRIRTVDLDRRFAGDAGDISEYINRFGYDAYARHNVETYRLMLQEEPALCAVTGRRRSCHQIPISTLCQPTASKIRNDAITVCHC